jgi:pimeloyl-ACP methyl ester carboxylesterase
LVATKLAVASADSTELACWDLRPGQDGTTLLMAHGTSLHGRCWAPVAAALPARYRALAFDMRGHGGSSPSPDGNYDWGLFATDALAIVDALGLGGAGLAGVGHSAGGATLLMAEAMRPGTFARLWAWEPIMNVPGSDLRTGRSAELAARARKRRSQFASVDEAREYLEGRGMFAEVTPEGLEAYLDGAFIPAPDGGLELACAPEVEAAVYEAAPFHRAWDMLAQVACPVRLLGGADSPAVPPAHLEAMAARLPRAEVAVWEGYGHFGPFHGPAQVAADIASWST